MSTTPLIEYAEVERYLELIGHQDEILVAVFPPEPNRPCIHIPVNLNTPSHWGKVERELARNGKHSLGIVVNPAKPPPDDWGDKDKHFNRQGNLRKWGASNEHISHAQLIWLEGDGRLTLDEQVRQVRDAGLPVPSFTIWTGGKSIHFYWRLDHTITPEKFREMQKRLIQLMQREAPDLQVDKSVHSPCQVMRLPGGLHPRTKERTVVRSISGHVYKLFELEAALPQLEAAPAHRTQPEQSPRVEPRRGLLKRRLDEELGWFNQRTRDEQHRLAVEMLNFLPRREQLGKGERETCIKCLAGLVNHFSHEEAMVICEKSQWRSDHWQPEVEIPTIYNPTNTFGSVIWVARQGGWQFPLEVPSAPEQPETTIPAKTITLEGLFPACIAEHLRRVTKYLPYDDPLIAVTYLAAVAGLQRLGAGVLCNPLSDFRVPLNLFVAAVGRTGTKKTPLKKTLVSGPLHQIHTTMSDAFLAEWRAWKEKGDQTEKAPKQPLLWVKDATGAALEQQLVIQERRQLGLLLLRDELAGIFYGMDKPEQSGNEEQALLEIYDGDGIASLRVSTPNRVCTRTQLSIFGNIQPEVLEDLQQGRDYNGKWARFLFAPLPGTPVKLAIECDAEEQRAFAAVKIGLAELSSSVRALPPLTYWMTRESMAHFADYEFSKQEQAQVAKLPSQAAILNKSAGKVGRVAGLLHVLQLGDSGYKPGTKDGIWSDRADTEISLHTLKAAIELVDHCDRWALTFQAVTNASDEERCMLRLQQLAMKSKGPVPLAELQRGLSSKERKKWKSDFLAEVLKALAEGGYGEISEGPKRGVLYKATADPSKLEEGWTA